MIALRTIVTATLAVFCLVLVPHAKAEFSYMNPSSEFLTMKNYSPNTIRVIEDEIARMQGIPIQPYPSKSKKFWYNLFHNQPLNSAAPFGMYQLENTRHPRADQMKEYQRWRDPYPRYNQQGQYPKDAERMPTYNKYN